MKINGKIGVNSSGNLQRLSAIFLNGKFERNGFQKHGQLNLKKKISLSLLSQRFALKGLDILFYVRYIIKTLYLYTKRGVS